MHPPVDFSCYCTEGLCYPSIASDFDRAMRQETTSKSPGTMKDRYSSEILDRDIAIQFISTLKRQVCEEYLDGRRGISR